MRDLVNDKFRLQHMVEAYKTVIEEREKEITELRGAREVIVKEQEEKHSKEKGLLEKKLEEYKDSRNRLHSELEIAKERIAELERKVVSKSEAIETIIKTSNEQIVIWQGRVEEAKEDVNQQLGNLRAETQNIIAKKDRDLNNLEEELICLDAQLQDALAEIDYKHREVHYAAKEARHLHKALRSSEDDRRRKRAKLDSIFDENKKFRDRCEKLNRRREQIEAELTLSATVRPSCTVGAPPQEACQNPSPEKDTEDDIIEGQRLVWQRPSTESNRVKVRPIRSTIDPLDEGTTFWRALKPARTTAEDYRTAAKEYSKLDIIRERAFNAKLEAAEESKSRVNLQRTVVNTRVQAAHSSSGTPKKHSAQQKVFYFLQGFFVGNPNIPEAHWIKDRDSKTGHRYSDQEQITYMKNYLRTFLKSEQDKFEDIINKLQHSNVSHGAHRPVDSTPPKKYKKW